LIRQERDVLRDYNTHLKSIAANSQEQSKTLTQAAAIDHRKIKRRNKIIIIESALLTLATAAAYLIIR